tara:strand:- start:2206 stop:2460 length:255 start_codon:yes stop_codon:yes gene_type:complete
MPEMNFGIVSAVTYFNAIPECTASAARGLLGVWTGHYFDDFDTTSFAEWGQASQTALAELHRLCGFPLARARISRRRRHRPSRA